MSDTVRKQNIDRLIARLQTITTANSYNTNLGATIEHWRLAPWQSDDLPACNVKDADCTITHDTMTKEMITLPVALEVTFSGTIADRNDLLQDVYTALGMEDLASGVMGGYALDLTPLGDTTESDEAAEIINKVTINIEIQYQATRWSF